ncbi:MAG: type II toxin-antitoxin system PemK/MazF family toxin [Pirellulales bacterium]|nr:type II toxin-antitoxin system PemK/MazF family toxin [Pirellulales bacterium]
MRRGEVVAFDYPFSDGSGSKVRPALVVSSDALPSRDLILAMISGTASPTSIAIDPGLEPNSGVKKPCHVRCDKLFSVDQRRVIGSIGRLWPRAMKQTNDALRVVLALK